MPNLIYYPEVQELHLILMLQQLHVDLEVLDYLL
jgi:hypothetical protein